MKYMLVLFTGMTAVEMASVAAPACSKGGSNVWGENVRTGKAIDVTMPVAEERAYLNFVSNLSSLGKDCFVDRGGYLEFGPIQSFAGSQRPEGDEHWASFVVPVACCVK